MSPVGAPLQRLNRRCLVLCMLAGTMAGPLILAAERVATPESAEMIVTVLGSGTPIPSRHQVGPAVLVQAGAQNLLFDCGRGCTTRLAQLDPALNRSVDRLFITHLHSDHVVGIDDLWLNGWVLGRPTPLGMWGPAGTVAMMSGLRQAYAFDISARLRDGIPDDDLALEQRIVELSVNGTIYNHAGVRVIAFKVAHGTVEPAWGFRVEYAGRSLLISGDTAPSINVFKYGMGVDVMLHEVMSPALVDSIVALYRPSQVSAIIAHHTTVEQAAQVFEQTKPRLAVYYHTLNDGKFATTLRSETARRYGGAVEIGHDLMQICIGSSIRVVDARDGSTCTPAPRSGTSAATSQ